MNSMETPRKVISRKNDENLLLMRVISRGKIFYGETKSMALA